MREYFLFDPYGEYLDPPLKGYRLVEGQYVEIEPIDGRLPSEVTGLHLEAGEPMLQLYDPVTRRRLPTFFQMAEGGEDARQDAEAARAALGQAEAALQDKPRPLVKRPRPPADGRLRRMSGSAASWKNSVNAWPARSRGWHLVRRCSRRMTYAGSVKIRGWEIWVLSIPSIRSCPGGAAS